MRHWQRHNMQYGADAFVRAVKAGADPNGFRLMQLHHAQPGSLLRTLIGIEGCYGLSTREPKIMPLLRCVAQFVSINEPHSAIYYAFKYHKGGNGADCSCVEQNSDVIRCLVEAGAKIPQHLVSECNVLQDFADMKDKAQSACMYFMLVHKSGRIPSLARIPKDVMRIICRDLVWVSRRICHIWGDRHRRSGRIKKKHRK